MLEDILKEMNNAMNFLRMTDRSGIYTQIRRITLSSLAALLLALSTIGCYGSFPLTNAVYKLNGDITESKWVHSIMLWVFGFFGVYGIAIVVDVIFLNLIEFWSGDDVEISQRIEQPDGTAVALETSEDGNELTLQVLRNGEVLQERRFVRIGNGQTEVYGENDRIVGMVSTHSNGALLFENYETGEERKMTAANIESLREATLAK